MKIKRLVAFIAGIIVSLSSFAQTTVVNPASDVAKAANENTNPDTIFWILGAVLVVVFIFVVVLALAKGTTALSENIGDKYSQQNQPS